MEAVPFLLGASAVASTAMALQQGSAAQDAANYNATIQNQNAELARSDAAAKARQVERENLLRLGTIRAQAGASGGTGEGSVLDVLGDVAAQGELERQRTLYSGELAARGFVNTANLDRVSGANARTGSYLRAGSELLGGAGRAGDAYIRLNRT